MAFRSIVAIAVAAIVVGSVSAEDGDSAALDRKIANVVKLGPGVHEIVKNKDGRITSLVVVGQARISTVLGKAKGLETARAKADLACSAEFVKWLKAGVGVYESSNSEEIILLEGSSGGDADAPKESGKAVEKSGSKMESVSKGLVRGLQILHKNIDGETYTVIKGWKADSIDGVKRIAADLASEDPVPAGGGKKKAEPQRPVASESATSDEAVDFFRDSKSK